MTAQEIVDAFKASIFFYLFPNLGTEAGEEIMLAIAEWIISCDIEYNRIADRCPKYALCYAAAKLAYILITWSISVQTGGDDGDGSTAVVPTPNNELVHVKRDVVGRVSREYERFDPVCDDCDDKVVAQAKGLMDDYLAACKALFLGAPNTMGGSFRRNQAALDNEKIIIQTDIEALRAWGWDSGTGQLGIEKIIQKRARVAKANLNSENILIISSAEKPVFWEKGNISDLIENVTKTEYALCSVGDYPYSRLFGRSSAGLNPNNDIDFENYEQAGDKWRSEMVDDSLIELDNIVNTVYPDANYSSWEWNESKTAELRIKLSGIGESDNVGNDLDNG